MGSSGLRYVATVEHAPGLKHEGRRFGDVYLARLHLSWSNRCGSLCALGFEQERVVVLDRAGPGSGGLRRRTGRGMGQLSLGPGFTPLRGSRNGD